jgi:transcriptional regulator with XRE-family HTH domain
MASINTDLLKRAVEAYGWTELARRSFISTRQLRRLSEGNAERILPSTRHLLSKAIGVKPDELFPFDPYNSDTTKTANQS